VSFLDKEFFYFLPIVLALWYFGARLYVLRVALLTLASLVFYGYRHWWMILLILSYCLVDWTVGRRLAEARRRWVLAVGLGFNIACLCLWKYAPVLLTTMT